jgi:CubicO group peptidase (beta-lactamase class C family)
MLDRACRDVDAILRSRLEFRHVSHFLVAVDGQVVYDAHYRGPAVADVFSITKSVVSSLVGVAVREGLVVDLDCPVETVLPVLRDTNSAGQSLRHLLTMTRGSATAGPYDIDEVMALPGGWVDRIASAPRVDTPGTRFCYDNGGAHLAGAALQRMIGMSLSDYAGRRLFEPLGITEWDWPEDPDGFGYGFAHLRLSAGALAALGSLWLHGGFWDGEPLLDPQFVRAMLSCQNGGGPPENRPYGYLMWIDDIGPFAGGWAGQHVTTVTAANAVIVTTGDPRFDPGPPATDQLPATWQPARNLVVERLVPTLL